MDTKETVDKVDPSVHVAEVDTDRPPARFSQYSRKETINTTEDVWAPGRNIPWIAALELLAAALCTVGAILVVTLSKGKIQGSWHIPATRHTKQITVQPKLLLSVISSVLTLMLGLAMKEGLNVIWWRKVLSGSKVRDLERHWSTGSNVLQAAFAGRHITYVAVGLLLVTATGIAENTLMQRSTAIVAQPVKEPAPTIMITSQLATKLPYTGWQDSVGHEPTRLDPAFASIVRAWNSHIQIDSNFTGCQGTCSGLISGAGITAECRSVESTVTIGPEAFNRTWPLSSNFSNIAKWENPYPVFRTGFDLPSINISTKGTIPSIYMNTLSSTAVTAADGDCPRTFKKTKCTLWPAIVKYPVAMSNSTLTLDTTSLQSAPSYQVEKYLKITNETDPLYTTLGGLYLALADFYTSEASLMYAVQTNNGYLLSNIGSLVDSYYHTGASGPVQDKYSCNATLADPTTDLLSSINDLMFRVAVANSGTNDRVEVQALSTGTLNYYESSFAFLSIAVALAWLNILVIAPMFWGWWDLGRKVSLDPIEVAEAFDAPVLRKNTGHWDMDGLIKHVGDREVRLKPVQHEVGNTENTRVFKAMKIVTPEV